MHIHRIPLRFMGSLSAVPSAACPSVPRLRALGSLGSSKGCKQQLLATLLALKCCAAPKRNGYSVLVLCLGTSSLRAAPIPISPSYIGSTFNSCTDYAMLRQRFVLVNYCK